MSLEETAEKIANYLRSKEYVEVYSHHDADGIAAAAILTIALKRSDIAFRLRFLPHLSKNDIENPEMSVLCDLGASIPDFPEGIVIIDHHVPYAAVPFHINPRLEGIDGETELSAAGCAYLVASKLGDNRDLAGLVMAGIIGDNQKLSGMNQTIIGDAVGNNIITTQKGILLAGRTVKEQIEYAIYPYLANLAGEGNTAETIANLCMNTASDEAFSAMLLSEIIVRSNASYDALMNLYGESWKLLREAVQDAYGLTAILDACGKAGRPDLGYAVAVGDAGLTDEAWETALVFRGKIISSVQSAEQVSKLVWRADSTETASDVADILAREKQVPVVVLARGENYLKVSARNFGETEIDFEQVMKTAAETFGGAGGGHKTRAGGELPLACESDFIASLEAYA